MSAARLAPRLIALTVAALAAPGAAGAFAGSCASVPGGARRRPGIGVAEGAGGSPHPIRPDVRS
ncbi:hypothetical protein QJT91_12465, partial [Bordetella bronchiseptica]